MDQEDDSSSEALWMALNDSTRRQILDLLREKPLTTGQLAASFPKSRFAVMKHLQVLVATGLVTMRREGRERWNYVNAVPLRQIYKRWVQPFEEPLADSMLELKNKLEGEQQMSKLGMHQVALDVNISAPRKRVWKALTKEMSQWWRRDFFVNPKAKGFLMEPKVGGRVFEDWGDGAGVLWFTVVAIDPQNSIDLVGYLTPAFGGPATSMVRFALEDTASGVVVKVTDSTMGKETPGCEASKQDGWRQLVAEGLKPFVEKAATKSASGTRRPR